MIFDLLTLKDIYTRFSFYPYSSGAQPFWQGSYDYGEAKRYEIEEGCYFEFRNSGYTSRLFTSLYWYDILTTAEQYMQIHAMKITYRSNRGIVIKSRGFPAPFEPVSAPARDTMGVCTVLLNGKNLNTIGYIDIYDESYSLNPEETSEGFPTAGDYLIINKIEFLTI